MYVEILQCQILHEYCPFEQHLIGPLFLLQGFRFRCRTQDIFGRAANVKNYTQSLLYTS